jgi:hypothetical protein
LSDLISTQAIPSAHAHISINCLSTIAPNLTKTRNSQQSNAVEMNWKKCGEYVE